MTTCLFKFAALVSSTLLVACEQSAVRTSTRTSIASDPEVAADAQEVPQELSLASSPREKGIQQLEKTFNCNPATKVNHGNYVTCAGSFQGITTIIWEIKATHVWGNYWACINVLGNESQHRWYYPDAKNNSIVIASAPYPGSCASWMVDGS